MLSIALSLSLICFSGFLQSAAQSSVSTATISTAPNLSLESDQPESTDCNSAASMVENCEASTPGFDNLCWHDMQKCLCSTSGTWAPTVFDNFWSSCLAWASTADPSQYSLLGPHTNGVVQSRKCQTWAEFTATGGIPSGCNTSPLNTLSSTSLAAARPSSIVPTGAAAEIADMQTGPYVVVLITVVNVYLYL